MYSRSGSLTRSLSAYASRHVLARRLQLVEVVVDGAERACASAKFGSCSTAFLKNGSDAPSPSDAACRRRSCTTSARRARRWSHPESARRTCRSTPAIRRDRGAVAPPPCRAPSARRLCSSRLHLLLSRWCRRSGSWWRRARSHSSLPSCEIAPPIIALLAVRWQRSRAISGVNFVAGAAAHQPQRALDTLLREDVRNGDWRSCTSSASFSVSVEHRLAGACWRSRRCTTVSRSLKARVRLE